MKELVALFNSPDVSASRLEEIAALSLPRSRYLIAMTPRSGSSYLCDVMAKTKRLGNPGEMFNPGFVPDILKRIPGRSAGEYTDNVFKVRQTRNGVSGIKASWFQFNNFKKMMSDTAWDGIRFIYLLRRDVAAQAVSLFKATATSVFHTNIAHAPDAVDKLRQLEYDFDKIHYWYEHIVEQERGWEVFFHDRKIYPLYLTYEHIEADVLMVMRRIARYVSVAPNNVLLPGEQSVFERVSDERNFEWSQRYVAERRKQLQRSRSSAAA